MQSSYISLRGVHCYPCFPRLLHDLGEIQYKKSTHNAVGHLKFHENWKRECHGHKLTYNYTCTVNPHYILKAKNALVKVCVLHYGIEGCSHQKNMLYCWIQHCINWSTKLNCCWHHNTNKGCGNSCKNMPNIWSLCIQYDSQEIISGVPWLWSVLL